MSMNLYILERKNDPVPSSYISALVVAPTAAVALSYHPSGVKNTTDRPLQFDESTDRRNWPLDPNEIEVTHVGMALPEIHRERVLMVSYNHA